MRVCLWMDLAPTGHALIARGGSPWKMSVKFVSPKGAVVGMIPNIITKLRSPRWGSNIFDVVFQGLPPLAINIGPFGAEEKPAAN